MNQKRDEEFSRWAKAHLDQQVASLDQATRNALQQARQQAVSKSRRRLSWLKPPHWSLVGGFATVAVTVIALSILIRLPADVELAEPGIQDLDILVSEEDLELYQEMDFLQRLEQQSDATTEANGQA